MKKTIFALSLLAGSLTTNINAQTWLTAGNVLTGTTTAPNEFLGSTTNFDLVFRTNNTEKARLTATGNFGLGITSPLVKFHIVGNALFTQTTATPTSAAYIRGLNGYSGISVPDYTWYGNTNTGMYHSGANTMGLTVGGTSALHINSLRQVGIGLTNPSCRLQVMGATTTGIVSHFSKGVALNSIFFAAGTLPGGYNDLTLDNDNGIFFDNGSSGNAPGAGLIIAPWTHTPGGVGLRIDGATGNVGIRTNNATATLTVNGTTLIGDPANVTVPAGYKLYVQTGILTEKVKVALINTSDWADYVFAKNYELKTLSEVESFVNANKHLPGVPSAEELKEQGGFDVAKMDAKLLEKIEELTLYVIELSKQNKELAERLAKIEAEKK